MIGLYQLSIGQFYLEPFACDRNIVGIVFLKMRDFGWRMLQNYPIYFMSELVTKTIELNKIWTKQDSISWVMLYNQ